MRLSVIRRHPQAHAEMQSSSGGAPGGQSEEQLEQHIAVARGSGAIQQGPQRSERGPQQCAWRPSMLTCRMYISVSAWRPIAEAADA